MRKGDMWLVGILIAVAVVFVFTRLGGDAGGNAHGDDTVQNTATITIDGEIVKTIELTQAYEQFRIETRHGVNLLEVKDGAIRMLEADCPDKLCVWSGAISKVNETIVCLPHRLIVEIVQHTAEGVELDAIVR